MSGLLSGSVLTITGAASGIGRSTATTAAREGAVGLVLTDRDDLGLRAVTADLQAYAAEVVTLVGEITDPELPQRLVEVALARFGRLDAAVNNAGIRGTEAPVDELTDEIFDEVIDVNLRSVYRCVRAQLRQMYVQHTGSIVNVASASVFGSSPGLAPYVASKMGVIGLSKVASREAGPYGVRVNVVAPGRTDTPLLSAHANSGPAGVHDAAALLAPIPLRRLGRSDELADAIVYLCSDRSSFVNGSTLVVDGGRTG